MFDSINSLINLTSTKIQVDILVKENRVLKSKVKSLENDLSKSKTLSKEMDLVIHENVTDLETFECELDPRRNLRTNRG